MQRIHSTLAALALLLTARTLLAEIEKVPVDAWIAELASDDPGRAAFAAGMLGDMKAQAAPAIPALVKALAGTGRANDPANFVEQVREAAANALAKIGEPAVPALLAALENEKDEDLREHIIRGLGRIGRPAAKAAPALKAIVASDASENERFYAFDALTSIHARDPDLVTFAIGQLNEKSPGIRSLAIVVLGDCGKEAAPAVDPLIKLLADPDQRAEAISNHASTQRPVRADAAEALGKIGPPAAAAISRLNKLMLSDKDAVARTAAAVALARIDPTNKASLAFLNSLLADNSKDTANKIAAVRALAEIGPRAKDALPALANLLHHKDEYVRLEAVDAIADIGGKDAIPLLQSALTDRDELIRQVTKEKIDELKSLRPTSVTPDK